MKKLIHLSILCLVMAGCASYNAPKLVAPVRTAISKAQVKTASAQSHVKSAAVVLAELEVKLPQTPELHDLATRVKGEIDAADKDLTETATELRAAQLKTSDLEGTVGKMANENAVLKRRYDKLKFGLCTLAAAGALYLLLQFKSILAFAGPYAWIAFVAGPVAAFAFFWKLIDWVL